MFMTFANDRGNNQGSNQEQTHNFMTFSNDRGYTMRITSKIHKRQTQTVQTLLLLRITVEHCEDKLRKKDHNN